MTIAAGALGIVGNATVVNTNGGALTGRAVYSEEEIEYFRSKEPETALILIRLFFVMR